jgi:hypothetical protein
MEVNLITLDKTFHFKNKKRNSRNGEFIHYYNISGISSDSEYVPLFAPIVNKGIFNKKIVHYSLPKSGNYSTYMKMSYGELYKAMVKRTDTLLFQTKSMDFALLIIKGAIFERISDTEVELLFTVGVKEDYMVEMFSLEELDYSKFAIIVSEKFMSDDKYKTLYRRINKEVIIPHLKRGIDVITTNNIANKCFNEEIKHPKFEGVTDLVAYLDAFNL